MRKKLLPCSQCFTPFFMQFVQKVERISNKTSQLHHNWGAGSALHVWLFAQYHFQLHHVNSSFFFTLWAKQGEFYKHGVCVYFCSRSASTDWTRQPERGIFPFLLNAGSHRNHSLSNNDQSTFSTLPSSKHRYV